MTRTLAALLALAAAAPAFAQEGPPKPAPEMAQLKPFTQSWQCEGKQFASPFGPEHATKSAFAGKLDLDGFWVSAHLDEQKTKVSPMPMHGLLHFTWDAASKKFVGGWIDNFGGWEPMASPGWEGDKITFVGDYNMAGKKIPSRDVFIKKGDKSLQHTGEIEVEGKWVPLVDETCKR